MADRVIDCTGDADVAHFAGAEYRLTPKNEAMGMTTILNTSGINKNQFLEYVAKKPATYADWSRVWSQVINHYKKIEVAFIERLSRAVLW